MNIVQNKNMSVEKCMLSLLKIETTFIDVDFRNSLVKDQSVKVLVGPQHSPDCPQLPTLKTDGKKTKIERNRKLMCGGERKRDRKRERETGREKERRLSGVHGHLIFQLQCFMLTVLLLGILTAMFFFPLQTIII